MSGLQETTLWSLTRGQRGKYMAAIVAMAVGSVFLLSVPYCMKWVLDELSAGRATLAGTLIPGALMMVGLHVLHGVFTYMRGRWAAEASEGIVRRLRRQLYSHLERLPCERHDQLETGDVVQRCSSDVETLRVFMSAQIVEIARVSLLLLIAIPIMLWQDVRMSLISLSLTPLIILFAVLFFRKVRRLFKMVDEAEGELTTVIQENLTGIRVVRAFAQQEHEIQKFSARNSRFRDLEFRLFVALSNYWALSDVLVFAQLGIILIGGGGMVLAGQLSVGTWILFFWLMRTIIWPVRQLGRVLAETGKATVAMGRVQEILRMPDEYVDEATNLADPNGAPVTGEIRFEGVHFAYPTPVAGARLSEPLDGEDAAPQSEPTPVLSGLDLRFAQGETVAILGPPGAGKSTIVRLLLRLYECQRGSITIGGRSIREWPRAQLRVAFGVVLQDPFLYSKTIRENIALADKDATQEDLESAARAADIHGNVEQFPDQYDTNVGERGVTLSGGQRQRLAIARALLKDPEFLVLDDSLSAVDTRTEAQILQALAERRGARTTLMITHRLSSTRLADRIVVMNHGRVVQDGTHEQLIREREGVYFELCRIQGALDEQIAIDQASGRMPPIADTAEGVQ